jgi:hypothetical protein
MSLAISSAITDIDMAVVIASEAVSTMTGRDSGAKTSPAITRIDRIRRMVIWRLTSPKSHRTARIDSLPNLTTP